MAENMEPRAAEPGNVQQDMPFLTIECETGINRKALAALADEYGIARRTHRPRGSLDREWLHQQYVVRRRTLEDIGRETGMSGSAVGARARVYGIETQNNRQPRCPQHDFTSAPEVIQPTLGSSYAIRRLRLFIQAVRYPTLIEACQTHGIHPSTLTMQLKRLETDLGGPLLIRASRGRQLTLTRLGRDVVEAVEVWAHTLAEHPRETWARSQWRPPRPGRRRKRRHHVEAPGLDRFPALLHPAVRTFAGRRRLHRLLQAANHPSLAAYCRASGMSPSALTPQIQHLERDLQGQLLIRGQHGHRMRLTDFGQKVLVTAHPYADQLDVGEGRNRKDDGDGARSTTRV
ncbi:helix-turn-helix domain-containing protein [Streptomyces sp. ESR1.13]|uniref:helix-turn-helix domain-containing protein n=1 Tax=unclassified Streptomyces TaxID=2593676 RepID=UPI0040414FEE